MISKKNSVPGWVMMAVFSLLVGGVIWALVCESTPPVFEPKTLTKTKSRPAMLPIAAGTFVMGSPKDEAGREGDETQHTVKLTRGFWLARTEVTQGQWKALMGTNPAHFQGERTGGPEHPIELVSWYDAVVYMNALSQAEGLQTCYTTSCKGTPGVELGPEPDPRKLTCDTVSFMGLHCTGYRLPTEAEWEYAARAGTTGALYEGVWRIAGKRNAPALDPIAWYGGNSAAQKGHDCSGWDGKQYPGSKQCGTQPVAQKRPNAWGLHDMLGNVGEWTNDPYQEALVNADDPVGGVWRVDAERVARGGGWASLARNCRTALRDYNEPLDHYNLLGLRPARSYP